jgi:cytochrome c oxidase accessory protein FixG
LLEYFGKQKSIYPKQVSGKYRNLKWVAMSCALGIYYLTPFIRWNRGPYAPRQAVLIDLPNAKAYWFGIEIWPQEVYILTGILILAAIALFFVTSLLGRVWCGYFCPQTVWTDLFIWVEQKVQGDRNARKKLREGPWTWEKIYKLGITHFLWLVIAWSTAGSFVLYFNDAPTLVYNFSRFNVSPTVLSFIFGLTFSTYLMAGYAREQVCTYMCPYARFQSAMFDKHTLIIGYDTHRGEPRGKHKAGTSWENRGHCIDCTACVQVCPMGIDIRNGLQMECIACGLCVDACDEIMDKVGLPQGLIRYDTSHQIDNKEKSAEGKFRFWRPRTIYYLSVMCSVGCLMLYALITRPLTELHVLHDRNPLFVQLSDGEIRNSYTIKILNKTHYPKTFYITASGLDDARIEVKAAGDTDDRNLPVAPDAVMTYHILVSSTQPPSETRAVNFILHDKEGGEPLAEYESIFVTRRAN